MTKASPNGSRNPLPAASPKEAASENASAKLKGLHSNPEGLSGPPFWKAFRDSLAHIYTLSLSAPSEEERFSVSTRIYQTPRAILTRSDGTGFVMTRGPALVERSPDQLLIYLQLSGSCDNDWAGRRGRVESGDVQIVDYARPFHSVTTDYSNMIVTLSRASVPAALLSLEPHGLVFPKSNIAARLIGGAMQELFAKADDLTVSEAEAAIEGIVALTMAFARATLAGDEAHHVKMRRKAALDYIDAHLGDAELGPDGIATGANVSRASLYRLFAAEGGIRVLLLQRRLDQALRLMLADHQDKRSLTEIAKRCGFGGASQFSRAFRARFGLPPRQYRALVSEQDRNWHEARLGADGFDQNALSWGDTDRTDPKPSESTD